MNQKVEKLINKTAKQNSWDPELVRAVVDSAYKVAKELIDDPRHPRILIPGLGTLVPRPTKVEDEISKLLSTIKTSINPGAINKTLKILTLTAKRIRYEQLARRASAPSELVERAKQRVREAGRKQGSRSF